MDAERTNKINGSVIEEFYWNGKMIVYVNNRRSDLTYEEACKSVGKDKADEHT